MSEPIPRDRGVTRLIAVFKLMKVLALIVLGLDMLQVIGRGVDDTVAKWIAASGLGSHRSLARGLLYVQHLNPHQWMEMCAASFFYAALFSVEGLGLWFDKPWAEYFTLITTVSFIPFELYELVIHPRPIKLGALVINIAVAIYLWVRILHRRRAKRSESHEDRRPPSLGGRTAWSQ